MCGNGLRTVARYVAERDKLTDFKVDTMNASLRVRQHEDLAPGVPAFAVEISPVKFDRTALPFDNLGHKRLLDTLVPELYPSLRFSALAVPNPHLISFVSMEELNGSALKELGTRLNSDNPYFSDGVNVNFGHILGHNKLFVKTFERGVGFTNACGTGMSATSLALALTHPDSFPVQNNQYLNNLQAPPCLPEDQSNLHFPELQGHPLLSSSDGQSVYHPFFR